MPSRLQKYISELGLIDGYKLYIATKKQTKTSLQLSALKHKVWFRGICSDYAIFEQIFIEQQYHLPLEINQMNQKKPAKTKAAKIPLATSINSGCGPSPARRSKCSSGGPWEPSRPRGCIPQE